MDQRKIIYLYSITDGQHKGSCHMASMPCPEEVSPFLPADCEAMMTIARRHLRENTDNNNKYKVSHALTTQLQEKDIESQLRKSGIRITNKDVLNHSPNKVFKAINSAINGDILPSLHKSSTTRHNTSHGSADALDWDEAMALISKTYNNGNYLQSLLISCGCFLGLRISDLLNLKWSDICTPGTVTIREKKTNKKRTLRITEGLCKHALNCRKHLRPDNDDELVFKSWYKNDGSPISRQRADQILKELKTKFNVSSAKNFSTHSLRKTFGRRIWQIQCEKGRGDQALLLLCDVFGHSNVNITKRYLGIRQEEILSVYDELNFNDNAARL